MGRRHLWFSQRPVAEVKVEAVETEEELEPTFPVAPTIPPTQRIEGGGPLIGRIYTPDDGGNNAKIEAAARGAVGDPNQSGSRKAVAILDKATGQVLVRDIKNRVTRKEGRQLAAIMVGGMQKIRNKLRVVDPVYGTQAAPWDLIKNEMFQGVPRYEVMGEFAWDAPRASVNFNFKDIDDFEAHGQLTEALNNFETRGAYAAPEVQAKVQALFSRDRENYASRSSIERAYATWIEQEETKLGRDLNEKEQATIADKYYRLRIAHKHKLAPSELAEAKRLLPIKKYAEVAAANKTIKQSRKKQITGGGGDVNLMEQNRETVDSPVISNLADEAQTPAEAMEDGEEAEIIPGPNAIQPGEPFNVKPEYAKVLRDILPLIQRGASDRELIAAAEPALKILLGRSGVTDEKDATSRAKAMAPAFVAQLKVKGSSIRFSQRSPSSSCTSASRPSISGK